MIKNQNKVEIVKLLAKPEKGVDSNISEIAILRFSEIIKNHQLLQMK
jgi:hypothetical protein